MVKKRRVILAYACLVGVPLLALVGVLRAGQSLIPTASMLSVPDVRAGAHVRDAQHRRRGDQRVYCPKNAHQRQERHANETGVCENHPPLFHHSTGVYRSASSVSGRALHWQEHTETTGFVAKDTAWRCSARHV